MRLKNVLENNEPQPRELSELRSKACDRILKTQKYNEEYVNKKRKPAHNYETDDLVMVKNFETGPGKLAPAYRGPYKVIKKLRNDRYIIGDMEGLQLSQKSYKGTWEAVNIKPWRDKRDESRVIDCELDDEESDIEEEN